MLSSDGKTKSGLKYRLAHSALSNNEKALALAPKPVQVFIRIPVIRRSLEPTILAI